MKRQKSPTCDDGAWRQLIFQDPSATMLHEPAFMGIIEQVYKCQAIPRIVNGLTGVPAYRVRSLFGSKITTQPFNFYPALVGQADDQAAFANLVAMARSMGTKWYVEYKTTKRIADGFLSGFGDVKMIAPIVDSTLILKADVESQSASYNKNLRQNIRTTTRRAEEQGVRLLRAENEAQVRGFYHTLSRLNRDKHRMISHPWALYRDIYRILGNGGDAAYFVAEKDGEVVAGAAVLTGQCHWDYVWGAAGHEFRKLGLNTLLVDGIINAAVLAGAKTLGFGASAPDDESLLYFKSRWGCDHRPVNYYYWNAAPKNTDLNESLPLVRSLLRHVPLAVIRRAAPLIVPFLA
jgi:serine/alanine adding enzyme